MESGHDGRAPLLNRIFDGEPIRLPQLVGKRSLISGNEFIAGGEDGNAGKPGDNEVDGSDGGRNAQVPRTQSDPGLKDEIPGFGIRAFTMNKAPRDWVALDFADISLDENFLIRDHGIAIGWQNRAGHDLPAMSFLEQRWWRISRSVKTLYLEIFFPGVRETKSDSVHRDPIEGWERPVCMEILPEHSSKRFFKGHGHGFQNTGGFLNECVCLPGSNQSHEKL